MSNTATSSSTSIKTLDDFLANHKTKIRTEITHTRMPDKDLGIYGGAYCIPKEKMNEFYKLYTKKVFVDKKNEHLTECQLKGDSDPKRPVVLDFDFRYEASITDRQHSSEHLNDLVELVVDTLNKIVEIPRKKPFDVYVMEKPDVNVVSDNDKEETKDGIHLFIGIAADKKVQMILREELLKDIANVFGELPLTNAYDAVVDAGISDGHTNWTVYGSRKPGHQAYEVTKYFRLEYTDDGEIEWDELSDLSRIKSKPMELAMKLSVRNDTYEQFPIRETFQKRYDNVSASDKKRKLKVNGGGGDDIKSQILGGVPISFLEEQKYEGITSIEDLEEITNYYIDHLEEEKYKSRDIHSYVMALPEKYYENYQEWIYVGWALHNTNPQLFLTWMLFSSKSENKFRIFDIPKHYETWVHMRYNNDTFKTYSDKSIIYWLKRDAPEEYTRINRQTTDYYLMKSLESESPAECDIARVLYSLYKEKYRCASIKNKIWYEFINNRWIEIDSGTTLRTKISREVFSLYASKSSELGPKTASADDDSEEEKKLASYYRKLCTRLTNLSLQLKKTTFKNNVMREACDEFYEEDFLDKLDINPYLMCFENGVVDFKEKRFRKGMPEDYLSLTTGTNYSEYNANNPKMVRAREEITTFIQQLFPDEELNRYAWDHLASVLIGVNLNQTFNCYLGGGRNGKSKLTKLMSMILGKYQGVVPISLVTSKRQNIGSCSPEIAHLKGIRYAVMQEPSKGDVLNDGIMKEITGSDPITGRALWQDEVTFVPQLTLVVCTNNMFELKSTDDGTMRRFRLVDFKSKFVESPESGNKYEYLVDLNIEEKFIDWAPVFMDMLVKRAYQTEGYVKDCAMVLHSTQKYEQQQNHVKAFFIDKIVKDENGTIKKTELAAEFKEWFDLEQGKGAKAPKTKELYDYITKITGTEATKGGWKGYRIVYDEAAEIID